MLASTRHFGTIAGAPEGRIFADRAELATTGVHRHRQAGINGSALEGADSIVLSGGYEDDEDYGDVIIYTGFGGNDPDTKKQVADQQMRLWNRALAKSCDDGLPVRVTRGARHRSPYSPPYGYRYDGVYFIESYWRERGQSGFWVWRYRLLRDRPMLPLDPATLNSSQNQQPERRDVTTQRIVRSTITAQRVKELHDHRCQVCGIRIETSAGFYSEAAHIRPLGRPHDGPDEQNNILCLCPNHHVLFDRGGIRIEDDFRVVEIANGEVLATLRGHPGHRIERTHLAYHRALFPRGRSEGGGTQ